MEIGLESSGVLISNVMELEEDMEQTKEDIELKKFKFDKLSDYFKYIITIQVATLGFLVNFYKELKELAGPEWLIPLVLVLLGVSIVIALFGKIFLVGVLFKGINVSDNSIKNLYFISGCLFIAIIIGLIFKVVLTP